MDKQQPHIDSKKSHLKEWLLCFVPFFCLIVFTGGSILLILPFILTFGVDFALFGTHPNAMSGRELSFFTIGASIVSLLLGIKTRKKLMGKILVSVAFHLWLFVGIIGLAGAY